MKLDVYLKEQNLSLGEFAKKAGLSKTTVFRVRGAVVLPTLRTMEKIEIATEGVVAKHDMLAVLDGPNKRGVSS